MAAPLFLDLLWPIFLIAGVESVRIEPGNTAVTPLDLHDYPWSHSLATSLAWSAVFAAAFWAATRYARGAVVLAVGVFSHFVLDFVTHRPDMPLYPGSPISVGLGLWNSRPATLAVELALFVVGVAIYARTTRAHQLAGRVRAVGAGRFLLAAVLRDDVLRPAAAQRRHHQIRRADRLVVRAVGLVDRPEPRRARGGRGQLVASRRRREGDYCLFR